MTERESEEKAKEKIREDEGRVGRIGEGRLLSV